MRNLPVNWYEGQFLRPHHFQAADRYWTETASTSQQWDHPYHYGIQHIDISREALANHQFEVHSLSARMRDGTLVSLDGGNEPDRVNLKDVNDPIINADLKAGFDANSIIRVYLAVPRSRSGESNVSAVGSRQETRYHELVRSVPDETQSGYDQPVQFRQQNVRILLSTQNLAGYDILPIAQLRRASEGDAKPRLDSTYIPPVISIGAWSELGKDIVRAIYDMIGQKIEVLSQQINTRGVGFDSRHPGDLDRMLMLTTLNAAYASLGVLTFAAGVHPFVAYTKIAEIVGALSIFGPKRRVSDIPAYDHEDLARIFNLLKNQFELLLNSVREYEFEQRFFAGVGMGMQVSLEPKWFNSDWQWFIGVSKGDLRTDEVIRMLSPGYLDWKFGSARQVESLFQHRAEGLELVPLDRQIRALPANPDWIYYEIPKRATPAWNDVQATQTLALRLRDSLILNYERLQGERQLVVNYQGQTATLEFALFAVPNRL